jgi:hypothetical protein
VRVYKLLGADLGLRKGFRRGPSPREAQSRRYTRGTSWGSFLPPSESFLRAHDEHGTFPLLSKACCVCPAVSAQTNIYLSSKTGEALLACGSLPPQVPSRALPVSSPRLAMQRNATATGIDPRAPRASSAGWLDWTASRHHTTTAGEVRERPITEPIIAFYPKHYTLNESLSISMNLYRISIHCGYGKLGLDWTAVITAPAGWRGEGPVNA